jgi:adenine deaminase
VLQPGSDADLLVLHEDSFDIDRVVARGEIFIDNGVVMRRGIYE